MTDRLKLHINAGNLWTLPEWSTVPRRADQIDYEAVKGAGFVGLQHYFPDPAAIEAGLEMSGMARITTPQEARPIADQHKAWGFVASTWHVGDGFERDDEMDALAGAVLDAAVASGLPIAIETHRATMTQDIRRTLDLIERFPDLRFNADLSHWYTGLEMRYGDFDAKLDRLGPVFERVRFMHGRIGHSCTMQLPLATARDHPCWQDYIRLWTACFEGFGRTAAPDEAFIFAPELLPDAVEFQGETHRLNYAPLTDGAETSDRWTEALELADHARNLFKTACASPARA